MSGINLLLHSFERSWKGFSSAWKKSRATAAEEPIHDLRVNVRRLIATLELTRALSRNREIPELQKDFKRILKRMGSLRDVQVQLLTLKDIRQTAAVVAFKESLERREKREIAQIRQKLKTTRKRDLAKGVKAIEAEFKRLRATRDDAKVRKAIDTVLRIRRNEFLKCKRRFKPAVDETLHDVRIALKKFRYVVEAAQPVLGPSAKARALQMQALQRLMGDSRDLEMLRAMLEKWAVRRGRKLAVFPAMNQLQLKRNRLLKEIVRALPRLEDNQTAEKIQPLAEKTAVAAAVALPTPNRMAATG